MHRVLLAGFAVFQHLELFIAHDFGLLGKIIHRLTDRALHFEEWFLCCHNNE
jgi:hypothetical protein